MKNRSSKKIALALLWPLVVTPCALAESPPSAADNPPDIVWIDKEELQSRLDTFKALQVLLAELPMSTSELIDQHDYELNALIDFVKSKIRYEPYEGALRGAEGTLISGSGNSLDQSLLLATIVKDIGYDARVVMGQISGGTESLLENQPVAPWRADELVDTESFSEIRSALNAEVQTIRAASEENPATSNWFSTVESVANEIHSKPEHRQDSAGTPFAEERNYFFVEIRESARSGWRTTHPAWAGDDKAIEFSPVEYFVDSIPESFQHQVRFQVHIDRMILGNLESEPITPQYRFATANSESRSWTYRSVPDQFLVLEDWTLESVETALRDSNQFIPQVNDMPVADGKVFDLSGQAVALDVATAPYAEVFRTMGSKVEDVADALSQTSTPKDAEPQKTRQLMRVWLDIEVVEPGGGVHRFSRDLANWEGDKDAFLRQLARDVTITVETGHASFAVFLDGLVQAQTRVFELLQSEGEKPVGQESKSILEDGKFLASVDASLFYLFSDLISERVTGSRSYRAGPSLVARYRSTLVFDDTNQGFDIITNARRPIPTVSPEVAYINGIRSGVVDALLEATIMGHEAPVRTSAAASLISPPEGSNPLSGLDSLEIDSRAWWEVDRNTGATVARLSSGWGGVVSASPAATSCLSVMATLQEYVKQLALASHKVWGITQFRNIQMCLTAAMALAVAIETGGRVTGWGAMAEWCEGIAEEMVQVLCHIAVRAIQAANMLANTPQAYEIKKRILARFFLSCTTSLRTGRLWL